MKANSNWRWRVDEAFVKVNGAQYDMGDAVDHEGEVLETVVTKRRKKRAASKLSKKLMKRFGQSVWSGAMSAIDMDAKREILGV